MSGNTQDTQLAAVRLHYEQINVGRVTARRRWTCITSSNLFLACGSSTGSVYVYNRPDTERQQQFHQSKLRKRQLKSQEHRALPPQDDASLRMMDRFQPQFTLYRMISPPSDCNNASVTSVSISFDETFIAVGLDTGAVTVFAMKEVIDRVCVDGDLICILFRMKRQVLLHLVINIFYATMNTIIRQLHVYYGDWGTTKNLCGCTQLVMVELLL